MDPISVSALTTHIVSLFQNDDLLRDVFVLGEVSNWKRAASGHIYFSLKDDGSAMNAVMWRGNAAAHGWLPQDGDQVMARGYVDVYPERGVYQFYVNRLQPAGKGQLYAQFEALKQKLQVDGLFDRDRKRSIPPKVQTIGVVTSPDAAALRDICKVLSARWPMVNVIIFPTLVQGGDAPGQIEAAIENAVHYDRRTQRLDVLILARGGGSMEDLWSFNDERVAYAIADCPIPVISGVGHETDFTIADFVADVRAPTPSAAAAMAVPDQTETRSLLAGTLLLLGSGLHERVERRRQDIASHHHRLVRMHPRRMVDMRRQTLEDRDRRLDSSMMNQMARLRMQSTGAAQQLIVLNPRNVLRRGFSIVTNVNGGVVTGPDEVGSNDKLTVQSYGGSYTVIPVDEK